MRLALLATLGTMLVGQPVMAQNLVANHGPVYVGTLTEHSVMQEGVRRRYGALDSVTPVDFLCEDAPPGCEPIYGQKRLQLLPSDPTHQRILDRAKGHPVRVYGQVYRGDTAHNTPLFIGVENIEVLPKLGISMPDGLYTTDPQYCTGRDDDYSDGFFSVAASEGALSISAYEMSCIAQRTDPDGDGALVTFGCWGEGDEFDNVFRLTVKSKTQFQLGHWSLNRCEARPNAAEHSEVHERIETSRPVASTQPARSELAPSHASVDKIDLRRPHADSLDYGSRIGMAATITSATGLGTRQARISVEHRPRDALEFCALYAFSPTRDCLLDELRVPLLSEITADCEAGTFQTLYGQTYQIASDDEWPDIMDVQSGAVLDGSSASGYPVALSTYDALCLSPPDTRAMIGAAQYDAHFDALLDFRGKVLSAADGIAELPIVAYAFRDRPVVGELLLEQLGDVQLVMSGHYGFASREGASLLVDFAGRDILACYIDRTDFTRMLSYRFGTMIDGGLDGFASACPRNIEHALREYAPLMSSDQEMLYPGPEHEFYDGDDLGVAIDSIDHFPDVLGLGKVLYHDNCVARSDFNPSLFTHFGANWIYEGRFGSEVSLCRIMDSRHLDDDMIELGFICTNAGEQAGFGHAGLSRPQDGWVTWDDGTLTSQCHRGFEAASRYHLGQGQKAPSYMLRGTTGKLIDWSGEDAHTVYRFGEIDVTLDLTEEDDAMVGVILTASRAGRPYFTIEAGAGLSGLGGLGVFPMEAGRQTLVFSSFSGGASCCTELYAVPLGTINAKVIFLGAYYGDVFGPKDLDGDGLYEFEQLDFGFTFLPYSASHWMAPPPLILAQRDGEFYDATGEDRFRPAVLERFAFVDELCGGSQGWYMSACVSRAATSQILGTYEDTMATLEQRMLTSPRPSDWEGPNAFSELRDLLDQHLVELGYPPAQ